jgi:hypothetical protein
VYGYIWRAQAPIEAYNVLHKEIVDLVGSDSPEGLLVHLAYAGETGYTLVEVWESKEQSQAFSRDIVSQAYSVSGSPWMDRRPT